LPTSKRVLLGILGGLLAGLSRKFPGAPLPTPEEILLIVGGLIGADTLRALRNATVRFNGGDAVDCVFRSRAQVAPVGEPGMYARELLLQCLAADAEFVSRGTSAVIASAAAPAAYYTVGQRLPDDLQTGWATLLMDPAP
jgi:hypothetical protein